MGRHLWKQDQSSDIGNSHPSATANKAMHILKRVRGGGGGGGYKTDGNIIDFDKVWSGAPDGRYGK